MPIKLLVKYIGMDQSQTKNLIFAYQSSRLIKMRSYTFKYACLHHCYDEAQLKLVKWYPYRLPPCVDLPLLNPADPETIAIREKVKKIRTVMHRLGGVARGAQLVEDALAHGTDHLLLPEEIRASQEWWFVRRSMNKNVQVRI